ncbi:MAG: Chorismate dehydratase [Verrucomicrobiota bacterium]
MSDPTPHLRMAPVESAEQLAQRYERERRRVLSAKENALEDNTTNFRIGSVPHLNALPLTRGLEQKTTFLPPSQLAQALLHNQLDAALLSITEALRHKHYDVLDGVAVASLGEVKSVFLAHTKPLHEIQIVHCDTHSLTSVLLLKVLLAEQNLHPQFLPLNPNAPLPDCFMMIGDRALRFLLSNHQYETWDLGSAWTDLTSLPFVYAVWVLQRNPQLAPLRQILREAKSFGLETIETLIQEQTEFTPDFRRDYLTWHIHYHLGQDERRGVQRFIDLLNKHHLGPVYPPNYVA